MCDRTKYRLAYYLEQLNKEELKEFQRRLLTQRAQSTSVKEVASNLVAWYGKHRAWFLAFQTWNQMGMKQLCSQAQQEKALMLTHPSLLSSPSTSNMESSSHLASTAVSSDHESTCDQMPKKKTFKTKPTKSGCRTRAHHLSLLSSPSASNMEFSSQLASTEVSSDHESSHDQISKKKTFKKKPTKSGCRTRETTIRTRKNQKRNDPCHTQSWKTEDLQKYTQLLLLQKPCPRGQRSMVRERDQDVKERGHLIEIQDLFHPSPDTQKKPKLVILEGAAGIGKSTLARQVRRAWEEGQLYRDRFQHVFYFSCRELAQCKQLSLAELIAKDQAVPTAPIKKILSQSKKLLFILDGIDEPAWVLKEQNPELCLHWSQPQPVHTLLGSLLEKSILPRASLLLTARTTDLQKFIPSLGQPRWVEVLGFSESGRKEYFYTYFAEETKANMAFTLVESNPVLSTLCLVPWVSWLVCTCLKQQMEKGGVLSLTSQTTTDLCLKYLCQTLPDGALGTQLRGLCFLAAVGIWRRRTLFSEKDLSKQGLSEDVIATFINIGVLQKQPNPTRYRFPHLCLQEFFAAMSCVLSYEEEKDNRKNFKTVKKLLGVYGRLDLFEAPTMRFLFGLLNDQTMEEMENIFTCQLPLKRRWELLKRVLEEAHHQHSYSLGLLHCLYEIQDKKLLTPAMHNFQRTRVHVQTDMVHPVSQTNVNHLVIQTDVDLMVVTFCFKFCCHVKTLQLNMGRQQGQALRVPRLVLSTWTPIPSASWKILFSTLEFTESLEELDLSGNPLSHSAVQRLCRTLRHHGCQLKTLWLVSCGITYSCCQDLASVLCTSGSLTELDLQLNDLGNRGVRWLCEGLRNPACKLRILRLDQASLSDQVMVELRALKEENPKLLIQSTWKPREIVSTLGREKGEMSAGPSSCKRQRLQSEEGAPHTAQLKLPHSPDSSPLGDKLTESLGTEDGFWGSTGPVATEVVDRERNLYRVHFSMAGSYHWPSTGLRFVVTRAVSVEIEFCAWSQFLGKTSLEQSHMVAGPLFDIKAEQGAVAAVYLPHFVALQGIQEDTSKFQVAHFMKDGVVLEKPSKVEPHCTVLKNPSFSTIGVMLKIISVTRRFLSITSITLLYHQPHAEELKFHLYLIPNDCTIRKAVDDEEMKFQFVRIHKPPPTGSLYMGSRCTVSGSGTMEIMPKELELCYRSSTEAQLFSEIYVGHLQSGIRLEIKDKNTDTVVWETLLKPGDLRPASTPVTSAPTARPLLHFVDQHREQLVARVTSVDPLLDKLHGQVLSEEQYETVRAEATNPDKMRRLLSYSRSWDLARKSQFYQALKETHSYLILELWEMWGRALGEWVS